MKTLLSLLFSAALVSPAMATVSIEFQFGAINVPTGSLGVLVADVNGDGFHSPSASPGTTVTAGQKIGADDVIVSVFSNTNLAEWGDQRGFADQFAMLEATSCLAMTLQRYDFELDKDAEEVGMEMGATIHTAGGLPMKVRRRETV